MTYEPASLSNRGTRSRAEGDGRSAANQCCDMKADLATIGPEATLKARRCVGPTRPGRRKNGDLLGHTTPEVSYSWVPIQTQWMWVCAVAVFWVPNLRCSNAVS